MDNLEKFISDNRLNFNTESPPLKVWTAVEKAIDKDMENFIKSHRAAFDTGIPNLKIWTAVEKNLPRSVEKPNRTWKVIRRLAAAVALLIIGASAGFYVKENQNNTLAEQKFEEIAPDFSETEQFYNQKIASQLTKLANYSENQDPSVLTDLQQIDVVQNELKTEFENAPTRAKEEIIQHMIENYKIKLGILGRVLQHVEAYKIDNLDKNVDKKHDSI